MVDEKEERKKDDLFVRRWRHRLDAIPFFGKVIAGFATAIYAAVEIVKPWMDKN